MCRENSKQQLSFSKEVFAPLVLLTRGMECRYCKKLFSRLLSLVILAAIIQCTPSIERHQPLMNQSRVDNDDHAPLHRAHTYSFTCFSRAFHRSIAAWLQRADLIEPDNCMSTLTNSTMKILPITCTEHRSIQL